MLVSVLIFGDGIGVGGVVISVSGIHSIGDVDNVLVVTVVMVMVCLLFVVCCDGDGGSSGESFPLS